MDNASETSHSSPEAPVTIQQQQQQQQQQQNAPYRTSKAPRTDRPCDVCRKRKSKCVKEPGQLKCVLCTFHHRECTYVSEPQRRKRRRAKSAECPGPEIDGSTKKEEVNARKKAKPTPTQSRHDSLGTPVNALNPSGKSLLDRTLGLHRTKHYKYIGASSIHEERLIDLVPHITGPGDNEPQPRFRRVNQSTSFIGRLDEHTQFWSDDDDDLHSVEQTVRPHGPALVNLYFRIVHPSYPILQKAVWMEKYERSYREFSPPVLAAVYTLAMDWWEYDRELSMHEKPDQDKLVKLASKTLSSVFHRPKLSTVQAGLLLLQRSGGDSWVMTSQIVAVAEELGLHLDCSNWNIPDWEKGVRRRLTWAVYMQDKWAALIYGRPSHILPLNWNMRELCLDDFPESAADENDTEGSTEVEKGRYLFMHLAKLTEITAEAVETLYGFDQSRNKQILASRGVSGLPALVKPIAMKLKSWVATMPAGLRLEDVKTRKLCSNGYLHLSYFATEIIIHRFIIRNITPETPDDLRRLCREAARARLEHAVSFVEALRPEHLQGFWWFASAKCLALIRVYGGLLWATSTTEEEFNLYKRMIEDYHWSLKVRAKGVSFVSAAIHEMEENLDEINTEQSPIATSYRRNSTSHVTTLTTLDTTSHTLPDTPITITPAFATGFTSEDCAAALGTMSTYDVLNFDAVASDALYTDIEDPVHFSVWT